MSDTVNRNADQVLSACYREADGAISAVNKNTDQVLNAVFDETNQAIKLNVTLESGAIEAEYSTAWGGL